MKNVLDIYLKENGTNRTQLVGKTNISEKALAKTSKRDPEDYSADIVVAISEEVGATPGQILDRMLVIRDSDMLYHATNFEELKQKVDEQEDEFVLEGDFYDFVKKIKASTLSERETLGFNYGSNGWGDFAAFVLHRFKNNMSREKESKNLQQKISKLYNIKILNKKESLFRLRQLDY
ncbi:hypothetical protein BG261_01340 [Floricoccus tropicus]|uniref:HTH cro/C1-type domain-containing protein n=1 Tax=Floricoccus tropicus TaxID=1859473 RepID=A0A1E8GRB2_9LACT|nr:helix-turn-helix domain-containing protein [Floricoccus tropicus]OFI50546.1 hypothetical protein BG261_01340 [Floricoccus tropicus]